MFKSLIKSLVFVLSAFFVVINANADVGKGQKVIIKKLKQDCGFDGSVLAHKHTQDDWESIFKSGGLQNELTKLCPKSKPLKENYLPHVYDFLYNFAIDSGNVPSC